MTTQSLVAKKAEGVLRLSAVELFSFLLPVFLLFTLLLSTVADATAACPPSVTVTNISQGTVNGQCCYKLTIAYDCWYVGPNPPPGICSVYVHGINTQPIKRTYLNHFHILDAIDYCIMPGTSRTISVEAFDCNGALVSVHNINVSCPLTEECCDGIFINHVWTSLDQCCGEFTIQWNPETQCDAHEVRVIGAYYNWDQSLPGYRVPYCTTPGIPKVIRFETYDSFGNLICEEERTVGCPADGENGPHFKQGDTETPGGEKSGLAVFPNPTNGVANVSYTLPYTATVRLEVIDALGQPVALLDEGMRPQGMHTLTYGTQELASGLYQLKLTYGEVVVVQPLVVSK